MAEDQNVTRSAASSAPSNKTDESPVARDMTFSTTAHKTTVARHLIVIDTNVIVPEYRLSGNRTRTLLSSLPSTPHRLHVPEVVVDEVAATVMKKLVKMRDAALQVGRSERVSQFPESISHLTKLLPEETLVSAVEAFRSDLRARLARRGARFIPYPTVSHRQVMERLMRSRRPFQYEKDDEGYRDVLVWESALSLATERTDSIAFVSLDGVFGENGRLHADLVKDLEYRGIDQDRITLFTNWDAFVDAFLAIHQDLQEAESKLWRDLKQHGNVYAAAEHAIRVGLPGRALDGQRLGASANVLSASVISATTIQQISVTRVVRYASGELLASLRARVTAIIDLHLNVSGYWAPGEPSPVGGYETRGEHEVDLWVFVSVTLAEDESPTAIEVEGIAPTGTSPNAIQVDEEVAEALLRHNESLERRQALLDEAESIVRDLDGRIAYHKEPFVGNLIIAIWKNHRIAVAAVQGPYEIAQVSSLRTPFEQYLMLGQFDLGIVISHVEPTSMISSSRYHIVDPTDFREYLGSLLKSGPA